MHKKHTPYLVGVHVVVIDIDFVVLAGRISIVERNYSLIMFCTVEYKKKFRNNVLICTSYLLVANSYIYIT